MTREVGGGVLDAPAMRSIATPQGVIEGEGPRGGNVFVNKFLRIRVYAQNQLGVEWWIVKNDEMVKNI